MRGEKASPLPLDEDDEEDEVGAEPVAEERGGDFMT